jgi:Flp pilus assembly protein TadG
MAMPRSRKGYGACPQHEEGTTTLEFAIAAAIFFTMIFGVLEIGLALYAHHFIAEAARQGTRYAMVRGNTCTINGTSCTASTSQIQNYILGQVYPGIDSSQLSVATVYSAYPAGATCSPNANCANPGNLVTVTVNYSFPYAVPFLPSSLLAMSSSSSVVIAQ